MTAAATAVPEKSTPPRAASDGKTATPASTGVASPAPDADPQLSQAAGGSDRTSTAKAPADQPTVAAPPASKAPVTEGSRTDAQQPAQPAAPAAHAETSRPAAAPAAAQPAAAGADAPVAPQPTTNAAVTPVAGSTSPQPHVEAPPPPVPPPPPPPVRLAELALATQTAIRVTAREGGATARIVLHPKELGTVEIRLTYGADGISATVRADNPQAAQTLMQASGDLRQALASQGMSLLDLDIRDRSQQQASQDPSGTRRGGGRDAVETGVEENEITIDPARLPAAGSQVDVLA